MLLRKINTALPVRQGGLWDVYPREWRGDLRVSYVFLDRRTVETGGLVGGE